MGSGVGPADSDVVELAAGSQGEGAGGADDVGADAVVGVGGRGRRGWLWAGLRRRWRGWSGGPGSGAAGGVVVAGELAELVLQFGEGGGGGLGAEPFLQGLLESLYFALGLGVAGAAVFLGDAQAAQLVLQAVAAAAAAENRVV